MSIAICSDGESISSLSRASGLSRHVVSALIGHYRIRTLKVGRYVVIDPDDLSRMIDALKRHPGCDESFGRDS